jgi:hypothetical protein
VTGDPLGPREPLAELLVTTVAGTLVSEKGDVVRSIVASFLGRQGPPQTTPAAGLIGDKQTQMLLSLPKASLSAREQRLARCLSETSAILGYKARPLNGIWATAPYLHNGSVPTLYDLLLPPAQRPAMFRVGSRAFDPVKVGYVTDERADNDFLFRTRDTMDRVIDGNSTAGHDYDNAKLSDEDRKALVEYLKTL